MFKLLISLVVTTIVSFLFLLSVPLNLAHSASGTLLLSEVQTAGVGDAGLEFIEIYNIGSPAISLGNMSVVYRSANGSNDATVYRFLEDDVIPSHGYFLLVRSERNVGSTPDAFFNLALSSGGGGLALRNSEGQIVDSLGWGTAVNIFVEGVAALSPGAGNSLERPLMLDSDNNSIDFQIQDSPNPQSTADSAPVPIPLPILTFGASLVALAGVRFKARCHGCKELEKTCN